MRDQNQDTKYEDWKRGKQEGLEYALMMVNVMSADWGTTIKISLEKPSGRN